eukprot:1161235-Pelagomonas_calceolata.AAC.9
MATKQNAYRAQELDASTGNIKEALGAINDKISRLEQEDKRVSVMCVQSHVPAVRDCGMYSLAMKMKYAMMERSMTV